MILGVCVPALAVENDVDSSEIERIKDTENENSIILDTMHKMETFEDIDETHKAYKEFKYLIENGKITELGPEELGPDYEMTRAEFVNILRKAVTGESGGGISESSYFVDVPTQAWYIADIEWARHHNVIVGVGNGFFLPNEKITVEQMITMLYNYVTKNGVNLKTVLVTDDPIEDMEDVSDWAYNAVTWANMLHILEKKEGRIAPQRKATRTDMALLLYKFDNLIIVSE